MKRSELYAKVWSTPVSKLADEVGVSGSRIARVCKRHRIPTPPRGYWAKFSGHEHPTPPPLPKPDDDYDIKIGPPAPKEPSAWLAPGVLLRSTADAVPPSPAAPAEEPAKPRTSAIPAPPRPSTPASPPIAVVVDLELVRAAAAEVQGLQAMRELLQTVAARAVHAELAEAQRIMSWVAAVRAQLDERDPIAAVLRLAAASN